MYIYLSNRLGLVKYQVYNMCMYVLYYSCVTPPEIIFTVSIIPCPYMHVHVPTSIHTCTYIILTYMYSTLMRTCVSSQIGTTSG